jgi:phosphoribosylglycinamide formyltransferase-1
MSTYNVAVLASGGGTNLQALIDEQLRLGGSSPYTIVCVICDRTNTGAEARAKKAKIPVHTVLLSSLYAQKDLQALSREQKLAARSDAIFALCRDYRANIIVLAGYLSILAGSILTGYAKRIINLHPALLPDFGGEGMWGHHVHKAVLASGKTESGCTVHVVEQGVDSGEILLQKKIPVLKDDTPETLALRLAPVEHEAILEAVKMLCARLSV